MLTDKRPPLVVLVFPGVSLMDITTTADGACRVRCPGCGAELLWTPERRTDVEFVHEHADCPVLVRIEQAIALDALAAARN